MEPNIIYCNKGSKNSRCARVAKYKGTLATKVHTRTIWRCEEHKLSRTVSGKVIPESLELFDQSEKVKEVAAKLSKLINKDFYSRYHHRTLIGRYLKSGTSIMCNPVKDNKKWLLVYSHQIEEKD
jgi:hypothetical protein